MYSLASGLWLGTRTGAGGTPTLTIFFFGRSPWLHGRTMHIPNMNKYKIIAVRNFPLNQTVGIKLFFTENVWEHLSRREPHFFYFSLLSTPMYMARNELYPNKFHLETLFIDLERRVFCSTAVPRTHVAYS